MRIVAWVRRKLRDWLLEGEAREEVAPDPHLDCLVPASGGPRLTRVLVTGVIGLRLVGILPDGGQRLVGLEECPDREHWRRLWRHHSGGARLVLEDGMPFEP